MTSDNATTTFCEFLGQEFQVSVREWENKIFTLEGVLLFGQSSGTDFEHYTSFNEAHAEGVRLAHAAIARH
ncbi:MAG TPA: hypothetical protein VIT22_02590 [Pseudoxanthomonas sp.]